MTKQVIRGAGEHLKVRSGISEQRLKVPPLMIMCDDPARDAPEPLDAIGVPVGVEKFFFAGGSIPERYSRQSGMGLVEPYCAY